MAQNEGQTVAPMILASDGSEYSEGAVREAIAWAGRYEQPLVAVCTAQVGRGQLEHSPEVVETIDRAAREACGTVEQLARDAGVDCEAVVHEGEEPYRHIVEEAERRGADAIVMGRRGRRGLKKLLLGSVTALTIGHAPCKVFVVPRAGRLAAERMLVTTDGSEHSEKTAREAVAVARRTGGTIIAFAVAHGRVDADAARRHVDHVKALAEAEGVAAETAVGDGAPYLAIINAAQDREVDAIVVGSHGHTALFRVLMGSVAERVLRLTDRTVMVVR